MNRGASCEIEHTKFAEPAPTPDHMSHWTIYKSRSKEDERYDSENPPLLTSTSNRDSADGCLEYQLEFAEENCWNRANWVSEDATVEGILKVPTTPDPSP
jgi:hypothetical protein